MPFPLKKSAKNISSCSCGQLSVEYSGTAESVKSLVKNGHAPSSSARYRFFNNDYVLGTNGEATCVTVIDGGHKLNRYSCVACSETLFCVTEDSPVLIGIVRGAELKEVAEVADEKEPQVEQLTG